MRGWFVGPARELLGLTTAQMAGKLRVSEELYLGWEADMELLPERKFERLMRLLVDAGRNAEYVRTVFVPLIDAEIGGQLRSTEGGAGTPSLTRSVGTGERG